MEPRGPLGLRRSRGSFDAAGEQGLEVGRVLFAGDDGDLRVAESGGFEPASEVALGEAEPTVAVKFPGLIEGVLAEVEHQNLAVGPQDFVGGSEGAPGIAGVMQGLTEDDDIDALPVDGRVFEVAEPELQVPESSLARFGGAESDDVLGIVDGDDPAGAQGEQFAEQTFAGSQVGVVQPRQQTEQHLTESLPASSGAVTAVESSGDLVEQQFGLILAQGEHASEVRGVGFMFRQFLGRVQAEVQGSADPGFGGFGEAIEGALALAAGLDQAGILEQGEVGGDAGLQELGDLLEFVHGEFASLQYAEQAEPGGVGEGAEGLERGSHRERKIRFDAATRKRIVESGYVNMTPQDAGQRQPLSNEQALYFFFRVGG